MRIFALLLAPNAHESKPTVSLLSVVTVCRVLCTVKNGTCRFFLRLRVCHHVQPFRYGQHSPKHRACYPIPTSHMYRLNSTFKDILHIVFGRMKQLCKTFIAISGHCFDSQSHACASISLHGCGGHSVANEPPPPHTHYCPPLIHLHPPGTV